jgi:CPA2 family monovalent cation:H+ antiporter-2
MHGLDLLNQLVVVFTLAVGVILLCHRLRIPSIIGFLFTGALTGPHGLGIVTSVEPVELLAEIGVVLLLFSIGLELSLRELNRIRRFVLVGGLLQVVITVATISGLTHVMGHTGSESIVIGLLISLSSTAVLLKLLQERREVEAPYGKAALGVLIFQDIAAVPMMLALPLIAGQGGAGDSLTWTLLRAALLVVVVIVASAKLIPPLLHEVARVRSRELFSLAVVVLCFAVALFTHSIGLSLALGAFLAGLLIADSEYSHEALSNIFPFRDIFTSIFFVSVGMLLDASFLVDNWALVTCACIVVIILKAIVAAIAVYAVGLPLKTCAFAGLALAQVGEFSFVIAKVALGLNVLSESSYQLFLSVSLISIVLVPVMLRFAPTIAEGLDQLPLPLVIKNGWMASPGEITRGTGLHDHLIIVGFGVNGRNVARAAQTAHIPYVVLETNPETVRSERLLGHPIHYGDASQEHTLLGQSIETARVLVVAISDSAGTRRIVSLARRLNPALYIIARTRLVEDTEPLYAQGANEVIPEEFETSVEIFVRVLSKYLVPVSHIDRFVTELRADGYKMFRTPSPSVSDLKIHIPEFEVATFKIPHGSPLGEAGITQSDFRRRYEATLLAIRRGQETLPHPPGDEVLLPDDEIVVIGTAEKIYVLARFLDATAAAK